MKRNTALAILNWAAALVMLGGCFDMFTPSVPSNLLGYLEVGKADMSSQLSSLLLGLLRALGGCLLAIGITALVLINGPIKRGERWTPWALLILIGISEGINASQMWSMKASSKRLAILGAVLLLIPVLYLGALFVVHDFDADFLAIDSCLDSGGRWNYTTKTCEH